MNVSRRLRLGAAKRGCVVGVFARLGTWLVPPAHPVFLLPHHRHTPCPSFKSSMRSGARNLTLPRAATTPARTLSPRWTVRGGFCLFSFLFVCPKPGFGVCFSSAPAALALTKCVAVPPAILSEPVVLSDVDRTATVLVDSGGLACECRQERAWGGVRADTGAMHGEWAWKVGMGSWNCGSPCA